MENNKLSPEEMRETLNNQIERLMRQTGHDRKTVLENLITLTKKKLESLTSKKNSEIKRGETIE